MNNTSEISYTSSCYLKELVDRTHQCICTPKKSINHAHSEEISQGHTIQAHWNYQNNQGETFLIDSPPGPGYAHDHSTGVLPREEWSSYRSCANWNGVIKTECLTTCHVVFLIDCDTETNCLTSWCTHIDPEQFTHWTRSGGPRAKSWAYESLKPKYKEERFGIPRTCSKLLLFAVEPEENVFNDHVFRISCAFKGQLIRFPISSVKCKTELFQIEFDIKTYQLTILSDGDKRNPLVYDLCSAIQKVFNL